MESPELKWLRASERPRFYFERLHKHLVCSPRLAKIQQPTNPESNHLTVADLINRAHQSQSTAQSGTNLKAGLVEYGSAIHDWGQPERFGKAFTPVAHPAWWHTLKIEIFNNRKPCLATC